jgi:hypothetical protein
MAATVLGMPVRARNLKILPSDFYYRTETGKYKVFDCIISPNFGLQNKILDVAIIRLCLVGIVSFLVTTTK